MKDRQRPATERVRAQLIVGPGVLQEGSVTCHPDHGVPDVLIVEGRVFQMWRRMRPDHFIYRMIEGPTRGWEPGWPAVCDARDSHGVRCKLEANYRGGHQL